MQTQQEGLLYIVLMIFKLLHNICNNKHPESLQKHLFKTIILEIELTGYSKY